MRVAGAAALVLAMGASLAAQGRAAAPAPARPRVEVHTWASQTAVWVGDRFVYEIELRRPPTVEVFLDDLLPEKLHLDGLEVIDTATEHDASNAAVVVDRLRYTLAAYGVEAQTVGIGAVTVRVSERRAGQAPGDALPAGEVVVPPLHVGLRSAIAASGDAIEIRDRRTVHAVPRRVQLAERAGWTLLAVSTVPVLLWAIQLVRRIRRARPRRPVRVPARQRRAALDALRAADVSTPAARREAYEKLDAWIREGLSAPGGAAAVALTPEEAGAAVGDGGERQVLERVLLDCERAKYGQDVPGADRWAADLDAASTLSLTGTPS
jgi:hypothetical protein